MCTANSNIKKPHFLISLYLLQKPRWRPESSTHSINAVEELKTSRSLLNVGDHLPVTTKARRRSRKCAQQKKDSCIKMMRTMCNAPLCIDCVSNHTIPN
ncbi:hypothetical protein TNCT_301041 [Trichonephila clavata]|uniref:Uncharacterized protein n=1 Tax=Trichonephila clavata TaxID=2740835 RepID=A0A8X6GL01_TRICU|nr:hypothetical protein TNCT_301041 [Trichonephila clavata]